jgi:SAM-dependent methyltransferase
MQEKLIPFLRCPVTRSPLQLRILKKSQKIFTNGIQEIVSEGILFAEKDWFYPVIGGIPRLSVESFIDQAAFLTRHLPDYAQRRASLLANHPSLIAQAQKKNRKTRESFSIEWGIYDYKEDRTWGAEGEGLLNRFLEETAETRGSMNGKLIFDAGCGNGHLDQFIAGAGATVIGMDFSQSIERAFDENRHSDALFIQGDIQFPPVEFGRFDIVHSSGVLHHTHSTELSFGCIELCVKARGKLSIWLYSPRQDRLHRMFNGIRRWMGPLPLKAKYLILRGIFLPGTYILKRLRGNRQNRREMMIALMDQFTTEFRWEHTPDEAAGWFSKRGYFSIRVTTTDMWGFNIIGIKSA